ncbi:hypothetical protein HDU93_009916 [Gonapodya sp. JEL0774]|nr:hypothetical protein HDU93_009916 [Gonapodya sp. JEL0774]
MDSVVRLTVPRPSHRASSVPKPEPVKVLEAALSKFPSVAHFEGLEIYFPQDGPKDPRINQMSVAIPETRRRTVTSLVCFSEFEVRDTPSLNALLCAPLFFPNLQELSFFDIMWDHVRAPLRLESLPPLPFPTIHKLSVRVVTRGPEENVTPQHDQANEETLVHIMRLFPGLQRLIVAHKTSQWGNKPLTNHVIARLGKILTTLFGAVPPGCTVECSKLDLDEEQLDLLGNFMRDGKKAGPVGLVGWNGTTALVWTRPKVE